MPYDKHTIDKHLEKYWEGMSDLDDENALKAYFLDGEIHKDHLPFAPLFQTFAEQKNITHDKELELPKVQEAKEVSMMSWIRRVAAVGVLALVSVTAFQLLSKSQDPPSNVVVYNSIEDKDAALQATKDALAVFGSRLNEGNSIVNEKIHQLEQLNKIGKIF